MHVVMAGGSAARTGLRGQEAAAAGYDPVTISSEADDHKAYYPGSHRIAMRVTGDRRTGQLVGMPLFGHKHALSYTPPLESPWEAVQMGAQAWAREVPLLRT